MKHLALLLLLHAAFNKPNTLNNLRDLFQASYADENACAELGKRTANICTKDNAILLGYKAMAEMMKCRYLKSPVEKLQYFNRGKKILESAIEKEPYNTELRYLRYVVQCNAPAILHYVRNKQEDKEVLLNFISLRRGAEEGEDQLYDMVLKAVKKSE